MGIHVHPSRGMPAAPQLYFSGVKAHMWEEGFDSHVLIFWGLFFGIDF